MTTAMTMSTTSVFLLKRPRRCCASLTRTPARRAGGRGGDERIERRRVSDPRRIGFALVVAMAREGGDEGAWRHRPMRAITRPGSSLPSGRFAGSIARSTSALLAPRTRIVLQWRYWSLTKSTAWPSAARPASPPGTTTPSHSTAGAVSIVTSTWIGSPDAGRTAPRRAPTKRGTAPAAASAAWTARSDAPSMPSATSSATWRVLTLPSPGRAISDSAGDVVTSGAAGVLEHARLRRRHGDADAVGDALRELGRDVGEHRDRRARGSPRRRPWSARSGTRRRCGSSRSRLWLSKNRRAWVKWSANFSGLPRTLSSITGCGNGTKPRMPAWNGQPPPSEFGS